MPNPLRVVQFPRRRPGCRCCAATVMTGLSKAPRPPIGPGVRSPGSTPPGKECRSALGPSGSAGPDPHPAHTGNSTEGRAERIAARLRTPAPKLYRRRAEQSLGSWMNSPSCSSEPASPESSCLSWRTCRPEPPGYGQRPRPGRGLVEAQPPHPVLTPTPAVGARTVPRIIIDAVSKNFPTVKPLTGQPDRNNPELRTDLRIRGLSENKIAETWTRPALTKSVTGTPAVDELGTAPDYA